jgi:hypothetical protein
MRNIYLLPVVLIIGITASHVMFAFVVFFSNIRLSGTVSLLSAAGYLTVPNHLVATSLNTWEPAIAGALFFSLTVGAGLCLVTFISMLAWRTLFRSHITALAVILAFWAALLYRINADGFNPWATLACLIIPLIAARLTLVLLLKKGNISPWSALAFPLAGFLIIIAFWVPRADDDTFLRIRDHLLLSNPAGEKITRFYYQYTLYPAEVFKSLDQRLLKTAAIHVDDPGLTKKIADRLRVEDYLPVDDNVSVDLRITGHNGQLTLHHKDRKVLESGASDFMADPDGVLQSFSIKSDVWRFFRKITFLSLVIASPFLIYLLLQTAIFVSLFPLRLMCLRMMLSTLICAGIGVLLSFTVGSTSGNDMTPEKIDRFLRSTDRHQRIKALKALSESQFGIDEYPDLAAGAHKRSVPERYWLAKALVDSRFPVADEMLLEFLKDPHPNVVCMALFSLGKRKRKQATEEMIHIIRTHEHWYVQWYAYRSLRSLGWIQPASVRRDLSSPPGLSPQ